MDANQDASLLAQTLVELQNQSAQQLAVMKKQLRLFRLIALVLAVALVILAISLGTTFVRINHTIKSVEAATADLAAADWTGMVENINDLVQSSQQSLEEATSKIDSIDIETLNQSIHDLNTVIGPIARLFGG